MDRRKASGFLVPIVHDGLRDGHPQPTPKGSRMVPYQTYMTSSVVKWVQSSVIIKSFIYAARCRGFQIAGVELRPIGWNRPAVEAKARKSCYNDCHIWVANLPQGYQPLLIVRR